MHVLVVISGVLPYPKASSGNPVVTWAVVKSLLDRGITFPYAHSIAGVTISIVMKRGLFSKI